MEGAEEFSDEDERLQYLDELKNGPKEIPTYNEDSDEDDVEEYDEMSE